MIVRRGFRQAASYHTDKLIKAPVGHFFDVMTNGFGAMPSYASRVEPDDRWRIAAYIRVLQLSRERHARRCARGPARRDWRAARNDACRLRSAAQIGQWQRNSLLVGIAGSAAGDRRASCSIASSSCAPICSPICTGPAWRSDAWPFC